MMSQLVVLWLASCNTQALSSKLVDTVRSTHVVKFPTKSNSKPFISRPLPKKKLAVTCPTCGIKDHVIDVERKTNEIVSLWLMY